MDVDFEGCEWRVVGGGVGREKIKCGGGGGG